MHNEYSLNFELFGRVFDGIMTGEEKTALLLKMNRRKKSHFVFPAIWLTNQNLYATICLKFKKERRKSIC